VWSDENPHATPSPHQKRQFSINLWDRILGDSLIGPQISGRDRLNALRTVYYWKMCLSDPVFACGFNPTVLRRITIVKCISGSRAARNLWWTLHWTRTWSSSFLACTITWLECSRFCFLWGIWEARSTSVWPILHLIQQFASEIKNTPGIFESLWVYFRPELSSVPVNMEAISSTSSKQIKINFGSI
jgi:hypothetical protein